MQEINDPSCLYLSDLSFSSETWFSSYLCIFVQFERKTVESIWRFSKGLVVLLSFLIHHILILYIYLLSTISIDWVKWNYIIFSYESYLFLVCFGIQLKINIIKHYNGTFLLMEHIGTQVSYSFENMLQVVFR